jgi:predicted  nucleic acid-binding Zn-ribbon protein
MTTQDLINTLKQGKPMTDKLMREIVRELEEKTEQARTMSTALRAKDADHAALADALAQEEQHTAELTQKNRALAEELADAKNKGSAAERAIMGVRDVCALPDVSLEDLPGQIENLLSELADRQIRADIEPSEFVHGCGGAS